MRQQRIPGSVPETRNHQRNKHRRGDQRSKHAGVAQQTQLCPYPGSLGLAQEAGFDLVEVAPQAQPPVCRILDYGKFKYDQSKKQKEAKKKAHTVDIKGIRMRYGTEAHDLDYRVKDARKFLEEGNKVQVTLIFRGRELTLREHVKRHDQRRHDQPQDDDHRLVAKGCRKRP